MPSNKREYSQRYYQEHKEELKKTARDWHWQHREECLPKMREYARNHKAENQKSQRRTSLCTRDENGNVLVITGLNKRPHLGYCELCKAENVRLNYHHWDDGDYNKGIWLCHKCHILVEMIDSGISIEGLIEKYKGLKCKIEVEFITL